jgi:hypothetical protein
MVSVVVTELVNALGVMVCRGVRVTDTVAV